MMVKVELEFPSVDAAIVALSKLSSVVAKVSTPATLPPASPESLTPGKVRKPRSDAGKLRGPNKNAEAVEKTPEPQAPAAVGSAPQAANAAVEAGREVGIAGAADTAVAGKQADASKVGEKPANSTSTPPAAASAAPKEEDAQAALAKVFEAHGLPRAQEVLSRFGVTRLRDLLPEQRAEFIKEAEAVAATAPEKK